MNNEKKHGVCPVERAGALDFSFRKLLQNPKKILRPFVREGMTVLDLGCGPGFFTKEMARLVGETGRVVAADLQEGMLAMVRNKMKNSGLAGRVRYHLCQSAATGLAEKFDFILAFYMFHEVPDQEAFLREIRSLLKPGGMVLIAEPKWHVSEGEFQKSIDRMEQSGFVVQKSPGIFLSRKVCIKMS
ncbi:MAG: class I SAM-dependent methyltransferase [Candidatus Aminicenantes bacterium]|nr:class I SAM-dependent methyltransferase [Candidatus Aminicenantes bacterium]